MVWSGLSTGQRCTATIDRQALRELQEQMGLHQLLRSLRTGLINLRSRPFVECTYRWTSHPRYGHGGPAKWSLYDHLSCGTTRPATWSYWCMPRYRTTGCRDWTSGRRRFDTIQHVSHDTSLLNHWTEQDANMHCSWRWCFYINLPPGAIVAGMLIFSRIPEGGVAKPKAMEVVKDLHNKLDLVGFALFAPSVMMLLLAVQWGGNE